MKKLISIMSVAILALAIAAGVSAKSPKQTSTAVFTVSPAMTCQNCENKIKSNLRYEKGVKSIATDLQKQTVTVTYDPAKTTESNIAKAFGKIGYEATLCTGEACGKPADKPAGCCGKQGGEGKGCGKAEGQHCGKCKGHNK
ncbi:MAG: cation transporter [Bacteroides sp.]|nr:cation transporter [Bacteroides sp.]MCM1412975.1 cation transporter [Bacteroides sp.]MCM1471681.1 cation transporter [Bacteroides sp.]